MKYLYVIYEFMMVYMIPSLGQFSQVMCFIPWVCYKWPRHNFSLQYQYNINQTSDENKEKYESGDY